MNEAPAFATAFTIQQQTAELTEALRKLQAQLEHYDAVMVYIHRLIVAAEPFHTETADKRYTRVAGITWGIIEARGL